MVTIDSTSDSWFSINVFWGTPTMNRWAALDRTGPQDTRSYPGQQKPLIIFSEESHDDPCSTYVNESRLRSS
jgi:hypothetical protein